jgi:iron complex outermembrane receptor protein
MNTKATLPSCLALPRKPADTAPRRNPHSTLIALAVSLALCTQVSVAAADNPRVFDIDRENLASALTQFAAQSDRQILFSSDIVAAKSSNRIKGELEPEAALRQLLKGTGLTYRVTADNTILVETPRAGDTANLPVSGYVRLAQLDGAERRSQDQTASAGQKADPQVPVEEEVIVTGFRQSLAEAHSLKRDAVVAEDVIVAEDIAAFPDLNLAESLQRIPGVTINRDSGEGRQITLRGLGPDFTRTQLNGMEVLGNTASGMDNRGGVSRTRSFDYSLFASELFDRVTVLKSYAADQDEGGVGGTVQLSTAKPFDYGGFKAVLSAKGQSNSNTNGVTPRLVGLISDRWDHFGALASIAYSTNNSNEFGYRNWGWSKIKVNPANIGAGISAADAASMESGSIYAPQADTYSTWYDHRTRLGTTLALQYEPTHSLKLGFDALYSRLTNDRSDYALAAAGSNALTGNVAGTQILQSDVIQGNTLVAANYTGVDMRSEFNTETDHTKFYQTVLHGSDQLTDELLINGMVGYSRSDYELPYFDKVFLESKNQAFGFDDRPAMPVNSYGFNVADPAQWNLMRLDTQANSIINAYTNAKLDLQYAFDSMSTLEAGGEYKNFTDRGAQYNNKVFYNTPTDKPIPAADKVLVPYDTRLRYIVGDVNGTYSLIGQTRNIMSAAFLSPGSDYSIQEKTGAAYLQYDLDTRIFDHRLRANTGLRYYRTDLTSAGSINVGGTLQPVSVPHTYSGVLPALNVALYVQSDLVARFSANRDISRPALSDLAAAGTISTAPFGGSLNIGNPDLKPFKADSVEGSLEYYAGKVGFASIGVFYKKLDAFISSTTTVEPYSATGYPLSFLLPGQTGAILYNVTKPVNVSGANIKGVEVAAQRDFDFLPAPFNHLGVVANGTYADGSSAAIINGTSVVLPLVNLSKYTGNATIYYETDTWGARISEAYRSSYLDSAGGNGNVGEGYKATSNVDFSAHYNITHSLKMTLEGLNLTDQHVIQYTDIAAKRIEVNTSSGRVFLWGVTAEF